MQTMACKLSALETAVAAERDQSALSDQPLDSRFRIGRVTVLKIIDVWRMRKIADCDGLQRSRGLAHSVASRPCERRRSFCFTQILLEVVP